jgi:ABC-type branched-subunit amino acid transport system substrate-binding protein
VSRCRRGRRPAWSDQAGHPLTGPGPVVGRIRVQRLVEQSPSEALRTSLNGHANELNEQLYCARGEAENRIREAQPDPLGRRAAQSPGLRRVVGARPAPARRAALRHVIMRAMALREPDFGRRRLLRAAGAATLGVPHRVRAADPGLSAGGILVGQSIALQGGKNAYAAEAQAGIRCLLDESNRNGGVNGRRIVLRTLDDENDAAKAEAHARKLVGEGAFLLFGSLEGGPSTAVMKAAVDGGVPLFGPMAGSPGLRRPAQPLVFPVRAEHRDEFRELIEHGRRTGLERVMLFHADTAVGREHLANVEKLAAAAGMGFGGGLPFKGDIDDAQLDALLAGVARAAADLVINHGSPSVYERLIRRARAAGSRAAFWGVNSGSTPLARALGPLAHGMVFSQIVPNPQSGKTALVREYQQIFARAQPGMAFGYGSLEGYLTAKALVAALRAAGRDLSRAALLRALAKFEVDMGGLTLRYRRGEHTGSSFVDLAMVGGSGRFVQ